MNRARMRSVHVEPEDAGEIWAINTCAWITHEAARQIPDSRT